MLEESLQEGAMYAAGDAGHHFEEDSVEDLAQKGKEEPRY